MATLTIPRNLAADVASSGDATRRAWLEALPDVVAELSDRWSLTVGEPYSPGGCCSWVAPARMGGARGDRKRTAIAPARSESGEPLVLKVGWSHDESIHEADGLREWNGAGAIGLIAEHRFGESSALLLERCVPGTTLAETEDEPNQDVIIAGLLRRLWIEPGAAGASRPEADDPGSPGPVRHTGPFRPLHDMCDRWADEFEEASDRGAPGATGPSWPGRLDPGLAREGVALFRELPRTPSRSAVLCTDLHAENVLAAEREPWLVIDPKPYIGDPAYDVLQHMLNCPGRLHGDPVGLARRMADLCDLEAERVTAWLLARVVVESLGDPELADVAIRLAGGGAGRLRPGGAGRLRPGGADQPTAGSRS